MISKNKFIELFNKLEEDDKKLDDLAKSIEVYSDCNVIMCNRLSGEYIEMMELLIGDEDKILSYWLYDCNRRGEITPKGKETVYINSIEDVFDYVVKSKENKEKENGDKKSL